MRTAILTISSTVAAGGAEDESGPRLAAAAEAAGAEIVAMEVIGDDLALIEDRIVHHCEEGCTFVFTTGGTGLTPDDVTPEATARAIEREAPGFAEALRARSLQFTPHGILQRGVAGIRGETLIVNLPGNPKAIDELFPVIAPTLGHAFETLHRRGGRRTTPGG